MLIVPGILGFGLVIYSTHWGAGWLYDSFEYIASAQNLAATGKLGFPTDITGIEPLTHYPPLFSLLLGLFEAVGLNMLSHVQYLNALLFSTTIILLGVTIYWMTASEGFALLGAVLGSISPVMLNVHSWALSEPLYLTLSISSILFLAKFLKKDQFSWLILAATFSGLAIMTRYVGVSLVISGSIGILIFPGLIESRKRRIILTFCTISLLPLLIWTIRNSLITNTLYDRSFGLNEITAKNLSTLASTLLTWFIPEVIVRNQIKEITAVLFGLLVLGTGYYLWTKDRSKSTHSLMKSLDASGSLFYFHGFYILIYPAVVITAKQWLDPVIGLTDRMLSPLFISLLVLMISGLHVLWSSSKKIDRVLVSTFCLYLVVLFSLESLPLIRRFHTQGVNTARRVMVRSTLAPLVTQLAQDGVVYTNSLTWYYLWTGKPANPVELLIIKTPEKPQPIYVVIFPTAPVPPSYKQALNQLSGKVQLWQEDPTVAIYRYRQ